MFGFGKKKQIKENDEENNNEESNSSSSDLIAGFDEEAYLEANPDVKEGIKNGQFRDALHHLETFGLNEIEQGLRKFHKGFESFDESKYLEAFPDVNMLLEEGKYNSVFHHFCHVGYKEIIDGNASYLIHVKEEINEEKVHEQEKVIAIIGVPRSGLTVMASLLGGNHNATTWFLPYGTRKQLGIVPFQDFASIKKAYAEAFPEAEALKNTLFISESTADEESIDFIVKSLKNLEKNGVEVHILWLTRNIHHTYISQMETAFKYWGAEQLLYDENTYQSYVDFVKRGYFQITEVASGFDTSMIAYEKLIEEPFESIRAIYGWLDLELKVDNDDLVFECDHVAGDPSFQSDIVRIDRPLIREETWSEIDTLDESLDLLSKLFVQAMKERTKSLQSAEIPYSFESYKEMLLEKNFDHDYYRNQYKDIGSEEGDPVKHYKIFGWKENRDPNAMFETKWYREKFFDDGITPSYLHFLLIGRFQVKPEHSVGIMEGLKIIDPESYEITDDLLLEAPKFKHPKVSIIVPAYNEERYTMACIQSIIENTEDDISYEIIIMDDNSSDESAQQIEKNLKNVKFISNGVNYGFIQNCNKGATFAIGEYVLLLNNDTNVQPGWLSPLLELIESSESIGMVGAKLVYPTGQLQDAGGIVWNDASGWNFGRLDDPGKPEYNYVKETDYLTGAVMMISRSLWEEIGGFDERYIPAYYDDPDLAFEVRKHGYKVVYQPKSTVVHFEGISNGTDLGSGIKKYQVINKEKFFNKWKDVLEADQFPNAQEVFWARDRSAKKRHLLYVDHYLPHYNQDAGSKATLQYLKILSENNIQVHFVGDNFYDYPDTPYLDTLQQMGIEVLHGNWYAEHFKEWFEHHGKYFDYAVLSRPHIAVKYVDVIRKNSDAKIIYMGHDLHFLREQREYRIKGDPKYLESSKKWQETEMDLIERSDVSYFFSTVEKQEILKIDKNASVDVVPLYIYDTFKKITVPSQERQDIMFVGGFAHSPNVDAMLWFVNEVWPKVLKALPDLKFYIIGSKAPDEILALASDSVIVTGYIDDDTLDAFYEKCKVVVAPLRYGAGIKGKIVDALYKGMPLVTTSIGAEGLLDSEDTMMIADKPKKFAKSVIELYSNDTLADSYAKKALKYCKKYFSTQMAKSKMSHIFTEFKEVE